MPSLEEKIKKILLDESKKDDLDDKKSKDTKDDEEDEDDGKGDTDFSKDSTKKDKAEVKEGSNFMEPSVGKSFGDKPIDSNNAKSETAKLVAKYTKNAGGKLKDVNKGVDSAATGEGDEKASTDTSKITKEYHTAKEGKLKEHMSALFDGETLSEEFQEKAAAIFEVAVEAVSDQKIADLQEEYQVQLDEAVEAVKGELVEQIDGYLEYVVEQWLEDNAVALESGIKVEMVSSFIEGMKEVFTEHYIDVPEDKLDVVEEQATTIEEMEIVITALQEENEKHLAEATVLKCEAVIAELSTGMTALEGEKLLGLVENIEFDTDEEFASKAKAIKESYFPKGKPSVNTFQETEKKSITESGEMDPIVAAVLKTLKAGDTRVIRA